MNDSDQQPYEYADHSPQQEREAAYSYQNEAILPKGRSSRAVLYGIIAGILAAAIGILLAYLNASTYQNAPAASAPQSVLQSYAYTMLGLFCLSFSLSLLIYFIAGFVAGKTLIERRQGFLAGFLGGAISYIISFIMAYVPGYPGRASGVGTTNGQAVASGLLISLIFLLVNGGIGGLCGALGARIATRRHPYYIPEESYEEGAEV